MTNKDYDLIALTIKKAIGGYLDNNSNIEQYAIARRIIDELCEEFELEDSTFRKQNFVLTCGLN